MNIKRFYKNEFPEQEDIVLVKVNREDEYGYHGNLIEYDDLEGFISLSEIVKTKYIKKHILKIGDLLPMIVLKVDCNKRIVDLSKKRIESKDEPTIMCRYKTCVSINKLVNECYIMYLKHCDVSSSDIIHSINDIMDTTVWKLYEDNEDKNYTIIYRDILKNPKIILTNELFANDFIERALPNITKRVTISNTVMEKCITLYMLEDNAISKIKDVFAITIPSNHDYKISFLIASPPQYKIIIEGPSRDKILQLLDLIQHEMEKNSSKYSCILTFEKPKSVCETSYDYKFLGDYELQKFEFK